MKSRIYLSLVIAGIIMGCSYAPKEIPPPSCYISDNMKQAVFRPFDPTINLNISAQATAVAEISNSEQDTPEAEGDIPVQDLENDSVTRQNPEEQLPAPPEKNALNDMDFEMNSRIQWWIKRFTGPDKRHFRTTLMSFDTIRPSMEKILDGYGIPKDLVYICMIESGGRANAVSPAGATGYWQFTADTARNYKLCVNSWVDERRDLVKSTHAAARYLKNLYALFNDWLMAGAAYNAGEGNIYRIIKNYPDINSYWDIKNHMPIKNETLDYIPKLIATIVLAKNRAYYGLEESEDSRNIHVSYETVRVPGHTYLEDIADLLNVPNKQITLLNADLVRQCTPPSNNGHEIKVPKGTAELVVKYVQKERPARVKKATHKVKKGENLSKIARANNVTVKAIMEANDLGDGDDIRIGQVLTLPGGNKPVKSEERHTHVVARGDTLRGIARQHGVSVEDIMAANDIKNPEKIQPKMTLNLPVKSDVPSPAKEIEYKVKKGDTIWSISRNFDVPAEKIMKWNKLSSNAAIFPGDNLKIRTR